MTKRRRSLPLVSPKIAAELRPLVSAISEIIEVGEGVRGNPLDRKVTYRDLIDSKIGRLKGGLSPNTPGALEPGGVPENTRVPPKPTGFSVTGGFNGLVSLIWDIPGDLYGNHAHTNIFRGEEDNFANASLVAREPGSFYTDVVREDAEPKTYYYWIRFTSEANIKGPLNRTAGTPGQALEDTGFIIDKITGEITRSELGQSLTGELDGIGGSISDILSDLELVSTELRGPESLDGTVAARIADERDDRIDALSSERRDRIDAIDFEAQIRADAILNESQERGRAIFRESQARETADNFLALQANVVAAAKGTSQAVMYSLSRVHVSDSEVFATQINQLTGSVGDNESAISEEKTIRVNENSALAAQVGILSARLDARPSLASSFEPGQDYDAWTETAGHTKSAITGDVYAGTQAAGIRSTDSAASESVDGIRRTVPAETATELCGNQVRLTFYAKQIPTSPAGEAAIAYTAAGYSSGWITFSPGTQYEFHSFEISLPDSLDESTHSLAIWGDTSGSGDGIIIDRVLVTSAETDIPEVSAAIEGVQQTIADLDQSLSQDITTLESQFDDSLASINSELGTLTTEQQAQASQITSLTAVTGDNAADITAEREARSSEDDALSQEVTALYAEVDDANAEIVNESKVRASEDELLGMIQSVISAHRNTASATFYSMKEINVGDREATATDIDGVQVEVDNAKGMIEDERTVRAAKDDALAIRVDSVVASVGDNESLIQSKVQALADADSAMAQDIQSLYASTGDNESAIQQERTARTNADSALSQRVDTVTSQTGDNQAAIQSEVTARTDADSTLSQQVDAVVAQAGDNQAAIQQEQTARADADSAFSQQINTVQSTVGENTTTIQAQAESIDGVKAQYSVKVDANGAVAGFGLASTPVDDTSDASFSEFYVNADRFAVMPQGGSKDDAVSPFIVQDNTVYLDTARIREGTIQEGQLGPIGFGKITDANDQPVTTVAGKLKADNIDADNLRVAVSATFDGSAQSGNYVPGTAGWHLNSTTGKLTAMDADIHGRVEMETGYISESVQIGGVPQYHSYKSGNFIRSGATITSSVTISNEAYLSDGVRAISSDYWSLSGGVQYLQADLGSERYVSENRMFFYALDGRRYRYAIAVSEDGNIWEYVIGSGPANGGNATGFVWSRSATGGYSTGYEFPTITPVGKFARYVRVWMNGNSVNTGSHGYEWELYGSGGGGDDPYVASIGSSSRAATALVNNWVKPGFTWIDGNKIYTGDAYVDTMQIRNQAVTVPAAGAGGAVSVTTQWRTAASTSYSHGHSGSIPGILQFSIESSATSSQTGGPGSPPVPNPAAIRYRVIVNGSVAKSGIRNLMGETRVSVVQFYRVTLPAGSYTISVQVYSGGGGPKVYSTAFTVMGAKR